MDRFEQAMIEQRLPTEAINFIKHSPVWITRMRNFTRTEIDMMITLYPIIYITLLPNTFYSLPEDYIIASKQYLPMDLS
jgi:uncharacterized membrane protein